MGTQEKHGVQDEAGDRLLATTKQALDEAIAVCAPGVPFCTIGQVIDTLVTDAGFTVCKEFIGHGIGRQFHSYPDIYHFENTFPGVREQQQQQH